MSRKDRFHQTVKNALEKEGWTIPESVYETLFREILIQKLLVQYPMKLIIYTTDTEEIKSWIV
jgi:XisH protein